MKAANILKNRFFSHSPFRLVHDITYRCNCKCEICARWKKTFDYNSKLSTEEIFGMLKDAKKAGITMYVVEGGEPLLRNDLSKILQYAKKLDFDTTVVTNGYNLKEREGEITNFTDSLVVSIDSNDELHDEMRRSKGLLKRAIKGIKSCKNKGMKIFINSVLCRQNLNKIEGLVNLSEELAVPIIFQPMDIYKGYNEHLRPTQPELHKTFSKIIKLKKAGYNIANSYHYLEYISENKEYSCHAPKCFTYVKPNGDIVSCCDLIDKVWGNTKDTQFKEIFASREFKKFCKKMEKCNECSVNAVIEISLAYSLHPRYLLEKIRSLHS